MAKKGRELERRIKRRAIEAGFFVFYRAVYIAGLATLIPMVFAFALGEPGPWYSNPVGYLFASLFLIIFAFFGTLKRKKNPGKTLMSLGLMSLVPGIFSLLLFFFGRQFLYRLAGFFIPKFSSIEHFVTLYLDRIIPRMGALTIGYLFIGTALYLLGLRMKSSKIKK